MPGGNLIRKPNQVLINSLSSGDVAVSGGVLRIKQYGNDITLANVTSFTEIEHSAGTLKVSQMPVKPVYPSVVANGWEGGIVVNKSYQLTGDPQDFYGTEKEATYSLDNFLTASSGYLNPLDCVEIAGNIVEQVNNDPYAIVTAQLKVYIDYTASGTLAITDLDGNEVLASTTYADVAAAVTGLGAISGLTAVADSTTGLYLSASEGLIITGQASKWDVTLAWVVYTQTDLTKPFTLIGHNMGTNVETVNTAFAKETLPLTEVQRVFPILPGQIAGTPNIPLAGTDYSKYIFEIEHTDASGLVGSNRTETYTEVVEFYLPATVANGAYWADIIFPEMVNLGLYSATIGATTYTNTGASGSGAGTMSVVDVDGFTVSSVKYYADVSNTGTINETTGVIANATNADVFYAEIQYSHLDYLVISQMTLTTVTTATTYSGTMLTAEQALSCERVGVFDVTLNGSGLGQPAFRNFYDLEVVSQVWAAGSSDTVVVVTSTGEITTGPANTDTIAVEVQFKNTATGTLSTGRSSIETFGATVTSTTYGPSTPQ